VFAADKDDGVGPNFSFAIDELSKAQSLCGARGFARANQLSARWE
jgi:hypothetical protein